MEDLFSNSIGVPPAMIVQDLCVGDICGFCRMGDKIERLSKNLHTSHLFIKKPVCSIL